MKSLKKLTTTLLFAWGFSLGFQAPLQAAPWDEEDDSEEAEASEEEEEEDRYLAIVGGDVYTGLGGVLRNVTILSKNGKIQAIEADPFLPEGTEKVDARGMRVYPGLVALSATNRISRGLFGSVELPEDHIDHEAEGEHHGHFYASLAQSHIEEVGQDQEDHFFDAQVDTDAVDSFDPYSQYLVLALATGITTAEQGSTALKLKRGEIEGVAMKDKHLTSVSFGSPASRRSTREKFERAAEYLREYRAWEDLNDKEAKEPSRKGVDGGTLNILLGRNLARFGANSRDELLGIARLAQRYGFRPVIVGCQEGWTVADELGRAGATAVVTPRSRRFKDEKLVRPGGTSIENAAILHAHGVQIAVTPSNTGFELSGITGRDLMHLPTEAGFAVRGGLTNEAALRAITIVPARILGIDHRVGSIEIGKDCDVILTDGDLLHYQTFVQYAVVDGKLVYDKEDEIFFAHIRPRPELPPLDPVQVEEEDEASEEPSEEEEEQDDEDEGDEDEEDEEEEGDEEDEKGDD